MKKGKDICRHQLRTTIRMKMPKADIQRRFGTQDVLYSDLLKGATSFSPQQKLLKRLVAYMAKLREVSTEYQRSLDKARVSSQELSKQNKYCKGDYVMFDMGSKPNPKMSSRHRGPYRVIA